MSIINFSKIKEKQNLYLIYSLCLRTAFISGVFIVISSLFLMFNYISLKNADPLNLQQFETLNEKYKKNPADTELIKTIRELDLLARNAFFAGINYRNTAVVILLLWTALLLVSISFIKELNKQLPDPEKITENKYNAGILLLFQKRYIYILIFIFLISVIIPLIFYRQFYYFSKLNKGISVKSIVANDPEFLKKYLNNWPMFRGPFGQGRFYATNIPEQWDIKTGKNILWKTQIENEGFSSPIVWESNVIISSGNKESRFVDCYLLKNGERIWHTAVQKAGNIEQDIGSETGFAASTLATDGFRIYAVFATGELACLDMLGNILWEHELGEPDNHYGYSSSLAVFNNILIVQFDNNDQALLYAFDADKGRVIWKKKREVTASWSSPIIINFNNQYFTATSADPLVSIYSLENGKLFWETNCIAGEVGPSLAYNNGLLFSVNEGAPLTALDLKEKKLLWENYDFAPDVSSPAVNDQYLVVPTTYGVVSCFNPVSGEVYWVQEYDNGFYASALISDTRIYLLDREGIMHIIKADKEFQEIAASKLNDSIVATPAIVQNNIILRGNNYLYCIGFTD